MHKMVGQETRHKDNNDCCQYDQRGAQDAFEMSHLGLSLCLKGRRFRHSLLQFRCRFLRLKEGWSSFGIFRFNLLWI